MSRNYLKKQPPSCTFKTEVEGDKIIWIDKDTPGGRICEDDQRSLSSDNYTYDYVPGAKLSAPGDYGDSKAKLALAYLFDEARKKEKPIGDYDTIASVIDSRYVQLTRYGRARVDYYNNGLDNTGPFAVGDTVVVAFEYQDKNRPVVVGFRFPQAPGDFYIRFKLNGLTPIRDGYQLKVTYGAGESSAETSYSVEGEYGLCGPFTCSHNVAYAYLYHHVGGAVHYKSIFHYYYLAVPPPGQSWWYGYILEKVGWCDNVPDPDYVEAYLGYATPPAETPVYVKKVLWKKHPVNLAGKTFIIEGGKKIYDIDFELKIIQVKSRWREPLMESFIPECGWSSLSDPGYTYSCQTGGALEGDCTHSERFYFALPPWYEDPPGSGFWVPTYMAKYSYDQYKNNFSLGDSFTIISDRYGINPAYIPSTYSRNAKYEARVALYDRHEPDPNNWEEVCAVEDELISEVGYTEYTMVATPEEIVLSTGVIRPY